MKFPFRIAALYFGALLVSVGAPSARGQGYTARDREFYWYGIGAGIAIAVCELERNGEVRKGFARQFIRQARSNPEIQKQPKTVEALIDASVVERDQEE